MSIPNPNPPKKHARSFSLSRYELFSTVLKTSGGKFQTKNILSSRLPKLGFILRASTLSSQADEFATLGISVQEKDTLVAQLIRYILFKTAQSNGCPIKREELTRIISDKGYKQYNLPNFVIKEAKSKLSSIFGYDMRELQRSRPSSATASTQQSESKS